MMIKKNHPYHLVNMSPWPLLASISLMFLTAGMVVWFNLMEKQLMFVGMLMTMLTAMQWWRDVIRESTFQGQHTNKVMNGMKWGMILFIISEIFFFISFFWSFYHMSLSPSVEIGMMWPPLGIMTFNAMQVPLLNTIILLSSGMTITWSHHSMMENNQKSMKTSIVITIMLGIMFSILQAVEYFQASFSIAESVYGALFFMSTGFHGIHVMVGTLFLMVTWVRSVANQFSMKHHFGFEAAAWYWHFVDVVWMMLYMNLYWWGG